MATAVLTPDTGARGIPDPVTFDEAALLFMETQLPEFTGMPLKAVVRKLQRWADQDRLPTQRRGRPCVVSYSDLLEAHARRHPEPGQ
ncbi:hypothetical protein ACIQVL_48605 [Streptomyces sp. NPDC090499]|uniref:hypothetical protein n=1 Tax=Streptomyces sp. NPDC090499 TaxID=3365965 RepID=UPI00381FAEB5